MNFDKEDAGRAEEAGRMYIEFVRWNNRGPIHHDLTHTQRDYLIALGSYRKIPGLTITQKLLGTIFNTTPGSVSENIKVLETKGYATTSVGDKDSREKPVQLTEKGLKRYQTICMFLYGNSTVNSLDSIPQII